MKYKVIYNNRPVSTVELKENEVDAYLAALKKGLPNAHIIKEQTTNSRKKRQKKEVTIQQEDNDIIDEKIED